MPALQTSPQIALVDPSRTKINSEIVVRTKTTIVTRRLTRLEQHTGLQITATVRPDLRPVADMKTLHRTLTKLVEAGTSHFRLNLSHFTPDNIELLEKLGLSRSEYVERWKALVGCIVQVREELGVHVFIMLDTAGPEFRISKAYYKGQLVNRLSRGAYALISTENFDDSQLPVIRLSMPCGFESFGENVVGREITFQDGECTAVVIEEIDPKVLRIRLKRSISFVRNQNIKVNFPEFDLTGVVSVGPRDMESLRFFLTLPGNDGFIPIDYVAQSFIRSAKDIWALKSNLDALGVTPLPHIIAKIETSHAMVRLKSIVSHPYTAAVMIARGDLGVECKRWKLAVKQREIIRVTHAYLKPVLVATELYGSMGKSKYAWQPVRAEILDLRHALEAGVDGIVFARETGGRYDPWTTVLYAVRQARQDEEDIDDLDLHKEERDRRRERMEVAYAKHLSRPLRMPSFQIPLPLRDGDELSTMNWACGTIYRANIRRAAAVFPLTVSGNTVRDMVHFLPYRPIIALTSRKEILSKLALFAHVYPVLIKDMPKTFDVADLKDLAQEAMVMFGIGKSGDEAFATMQHPVGAKGRTDTLVGVQRI